MMQTGHPREGLKRYVWMIGSLVLLASTAAAQLELEDLSQLTPRQRLERQRDILNELLDSAREMEDPLWVPGPGSLPVVTSRRDVAAILVVRATIGEMTKQEANECMAQMEQESPQLKEQVRVQLIQVLRAIGGVGGGTDDAARAAPVSGFVYAQGGVLFLTDGAGRPTRITFTHPWHTLVCRNQVFSNRGDRIAFVAGHRTERVDGRVVSFNPVYVVDVDGKNVRQVGDTGVTMPGIARPCWDPNDRQLCFPAMVERRVVSGGEIRKYGLVIASVDGTGRRVLLASLPGPQWEYTEPAWSPDGTRIAFTRKVAGGREVWLVPAEGGEPRRLAPGWSPAWSPTGRQILFLRTTRSVSEACVMDPNGSNVRRLTFLDTGCERPLWSPLGRQIAFALPSSLPVIRKNVDDPHMARVEYVTNDYDWSSVGAAAPITVTVPGLQDGIVFSYHPGWDMVGQKLGGPSNNWDICVMSRDGSEVLNITKTRNYVDERQPAWSPFFPDGSRRIAFSSNRTDSAEGTTSWHIFTVDPDGRNLQQVTTGRVDDRYPTWSPDGTRIAFVRDAGGFARYPGLCVVAATGGPVTQLIGGVFRDTKISWSPNGMWIAYTTPGSTAQDGVGGRPVIYMVNTTAGTWQDPVNQRISQRFRVAKDPAFGANPLIWAAVVNMPDRRGDPTTWWDIFAGPQLRLTERRDLHHPTWSVLQDQIAAHEASRIKIVDVNQPNVVRQVPQTVLPDTRWIEPDWGGQFGPSPGIPEHEPNSPHPGVDVDYEAVLREFAGVRGWPKKPYRSIANVPWPGEAKTATVYMLTSTGVKTSRRQFVSITEHESENVAKTKWERYQEVYNPRGKDITLSIPGPYKARSGYADRYVYVLMGNLEVLTQSVNKNSDEEVQWATELGTLIAKARRDIGP